MISVKKAFQVAGIRNILLVVLLIPVFGQLNAQSRNESRFEKRLLKRSSFIAEYLGEWKHLGLLKVDSIAMDKNGEQIHYYLSNVFSQIPARQEWIDALRAGVRASLKKSVRKYKVLFYSNGRLLEEYVPNAFRNDSIHFDKYRIYTPVIAHPWIKRDNSPFFPSGLQGKHIAIWPSHGLYFDQATDGWRWQRARLWQTVEDIFPWSFTTRYLVPMLEQSGAVVSLPRERDTQIHEVIVDEDGSIGNSRLEWENGKKQWILQSPGFMKADTLFPGQNPFRLGTSRVYPILPGDTASVRYIPEIPETGDYAVYVSYSKGNPCNSSARYEVHYSGGVKKYTVNQCMGAGTWLYMGTFRFEKGIHPERGSVNLYSDEPGVLSADAVRFGGGMGNIARRPALSESPYLLSNKPRWMEGSRYFLQYAGMPDTLVYGLNKGVNDYNDDYMSRPEWVNYMVGNARPQYSQRYTMGLDIPVDIAIALHTDAGVTQNDSVIGTLSIFSTIRNGGKFPDGKSKLASRDLADVIQTQVVEDLRNQVNPQWIRRGLWDREYSEAWRPVVPAMMLEMLSHQNLADMQYGLDPRFQFLASRAIYKGIVKYFAASDKKYIVQPLPPDHMEIHIIGDKRIRISWQPVADPLESSATPLSYIVYRRTENEGFDNGIQIQDTFMMADLPAWNTLYSFKVTAVNKGGESMSGETLSVAIVPGSAKPVLVVNAFDRVCAPVFFDKGDMAGIAWWEDEGVPHGNDYSFSGFQFNFFRNSNWISDDNQGWGASYADMEASPVIGNTFDFPSVHGKALLKAGYSFTSMSDESFENARISGHHYAAIDIIFGEERGTLPLSKKGGKEFRIFTPQMQQSLRDFLNSGGSLFISGAYIGTDMEENADSSSIHFASDMLHFTWVTNHATRIGLVHATYDAIKIFPDTLKFNMEWGKPIYRVEAPDAIDIAGKGAFRIYRYVSGNTTAGVAYQGKYKSVVLGFPFETISEEQQTLFMKNLMQFFTNTTGSYHPESVID